MIFSYVQEWFSNDLVEFSNKRISSFRSDLSQIFIILMEIPSWPCALCIFSALIILRISSSLKFIEFSLDCVKNIWFAGNALLFFKGVHCSAKNLLKMFAFVWISITKLSPIKRGGIAGIFFHSKRF